jgi:hypothetical protein
MFGPRPNVTYSTSRCVPAVLGTSAHNAARPLAGRKRSQPQPAEAMAEPEQLFFAVAGPAAGEQL